MTDITERLRERVALKPCPFCGGEPKLFQDGYYVPTELDKYPERTRSWVACSCDTHWKRNTAVEAIAAWNTRAIEATGIERHLQDLEAFKDYHGDIPDYDHPLRPVYESGIQYAVNLLAKVLKVDDWEICDGTEEFEGDLGGTLLNIVLKTWPTDKHGDWMDFREPNVRTGIERLAEALRRIADEESWRGYSPMPTVERMRETAREALLSFEGEG